MNLIGINDLILKPYFGLEYSKFGLLTTAEFSLPPRNAETKYNLGILLTYRFF
jgi:hypothetical protein